MTEAASKTASQTADRALEIGTLPDSPMTMPVQALERAPILPLLRQARLPSRT